MRRVTGRSIGTFFREEVATPLGADFHILAEQSHSVDLVLGMAIRFGMGFGLMSEAIPLSPSGRACLWGGWGGSIAVVDLDTAMTVTYVMNKMAASLVGDLRGAESSSPRSSR